MLSCQWVKVASLGVFARMTCCLIPGTYMSRNVFIFLLENFQVLGLCCSQAIAGGLLLVRYLLFPPFLPSFLRSASPLAKLPPSTFADPTLLHPFLQLPLPLALPLPLSANATTINSAA